MPTAVKFGPDVSSEAVQSPLRIDWENLSDDERSRLILDLIKQGKGPRPGRPRKDGSTVTWKDLGFTRMEVYYMRLLAQIPDFERTQAELWAEYKRTGRRLSRRAYLVHAGLVKNVSDENVFEGTELGELAEQILRPVETLVEQANDKGLRYLMRALHARLRQIASISQSRELRETLRNSGES